MRAGVLHERVAFDEPTGGTDAFGGVTEAWTERHACRAQWLFGGGDEAVQAARLAGRHVYKVKVRSCAAARAISTGYRMRYIGGGLPGGVTGDPLPGTRWDIRSVDPIADRAWVHLTIEGQSPTAQE